ncbi:MAG: hypothetical protein U0807_09135 [Candidatus Binatia bacterium]
MDERVLRWAKATASWLERLLALAILAAGVGFAIASTTALASRDWRSTEAFYEMVYRVLMLVIGTELARTLLTHDLEAILELLAFVVARKILKPEVTALDILLSVMAFIGLLAARRYLLQVPSDARAGSSEQPRAPRPTSR